MLKVIFLDIDGVLNANRDWTEMKILGHPINKGTDVINRQCLALLQMIIQYTGAKIVLSSTWRLHYDLSTMYSFFALRGFSLPEEDLWHGATPDFGGYSARGDEVQWYLNKNAQEYAESNGEIPIIESYVILDDVNAFTKEQQPFFIQTNEESGLTLEQAYNATLILNQSPSKKTLY